MKRRDLLERVSQIRTERFLRPALTLARDPRFRKLLVPLAAALSFTLFLLLTFPFETLGRRLEMEAQRAGAELTIGTLSGGGLFGIRARDVKLRLPAAPGEPLPELRLDRVDASPDLFALLLRRTSFGFSLSAYGGSARGHAALSSDPELPGLTSLRLEVADVDVRTLPLREAFDVEAAGKLSLRIDLPTLAPAEAANGEIVLALKEAALTGGRLQGFTLPRVGLGDVDARISVDRGVAKVEHTRARGGDLDAELDGTLRLRPLFSLSQADLHLRFKPSARLLADNPILQGAMGFIADGRQGDGSYAFTFNGPLSNLNRRPGR